MDNQDLKNNSIAILTTFYSIDPAYSLCNVVSDQLLMFTNNNYKIKLLIDEGLSDSGLAGVWKHPNITLVRLPGFHRDNDGVLPSDYQVQVDRYYEALKEALKDVKVVLTHDVTLQPAHLIVNIACRKLAGERSDLRWLHWSHSATAPEVRCSNEQAREIIQQKFPNAFMCYPNDWDRPRVAHNYKYELDEVKCIHHPSDFCSLLFGDELDLSTIPDLNNEQKSCLTNKVNYPIKLSNDLVREFDILNADVISTYPCRLDRGKQVEWNIRTMGAIKKLGRSVKLIIIDFHSTAGDKCVYRDELKKTAKKWGLTEQECIFTSEWREDTHLHVPRQFVMNMKKISDFHMHPSTSETFSLICLESMACRNFCVLNHHTPYMRDIYGSKNVLYIPMGGAVNALTGEDGATLIDISNEELHFENIAKKVLYFIEVTNPVIAQFRYVRQNFNLDKIFKSQLEPLLYFIKLGP